MSFSVQFFAAPEQIAELVEEHQAEDQDSETSEVTDSDPENDVGGKLTSTCS